MNTLYLLVGPTASGKTAASVEIAKLLDAEVIAADSMQVYSELQVGTARPATRELQGVPHHMLGTVSAFAGPYTVAQYQQEALRAAADIFSRKKQALVVGGTGLYVDALIKPLQFTNVAANPELRNQLCEIEATQPGTLWAELQRLDPESAAHLHPNDKTRIIRALEIVKTTGIPRSEHAREDVNKKSPYPYVIAGLTLPREQLAQRIDARVDAMARQGLVDEVKDLLARGLAVSAQAMQGLGYKEIAHALNENTSIEDALALVKLRTRQYAKRQMTWFRHLEVTWFDVSALDTIALAAIVANFFTTQRRLQP